ncbi:uncharacterized protein LOC112268692 [Brachypodium distachyon]|uniref:uncharacterized protein LOC112268692 n=1 Tax=Brachypodium distachyon TaxID=15368 RepID=UPI000D0DDBD3|nr:uncharacterized protein LOC112268692 [Brachypodium distachyon]|eukprot:XP_024310414.1 uncharacterized protein LOC112268692 [Brachypodium distachyon]
MRARGGGLDWGRLGGLTDREQRLKKDYNTVKSILNKSGFGWDPLQKVLESIDEKWDELSKEQRKWRYKAFPHYDDLHGIYDGKTAEGKRCKRTTDMFEEKDSSPAFVPEETYTESVLRAARLNSLPPTIPAPGFDGHQYDWDRGLYGDDVEFPSVSHSQGVENSSSQFEAKENYIVPDQPPKRYNAAKGSDERRPKKSKESAIDNLVAFRKEELQTYVEVKSKQIQSYRDVKMAQLQQSDPDNDPYYITKCIAKVKTVDKLSPRDHLKIIEYLIEQRIERQVFMTVDDEVFMEILKKVLGRDEI